jgi:CRP/FNR family transcriptional regulator, anaerobic regulatory protein
MVTRMPSGAEPHKPVPQQLPAIVQSGALSSLEANAKDLILRHMVSLDLKAGQQVFRAGDVASNYLVVKSGSVRVMVTTEQGREIVLYHVEPGQTCVLTASCLLSGAEYEAEAIADADSEVIILPKAAFEELMAASPQFRQFVFSSFGERLHTLIGLVQEVTLKHVDRRLARQLLKQARNGVITSTHQALALELNTAREVVTRLLNDFAQKGWLQISRGRINLKNELALEELASSL